MTIEDIKQKLLSGQVMFGDTRVYIKSNRYDQYYAEITTKQKNTVISNFHPQSGLNLYSKDGSYCCYTGTLNQIAERAARFLKDSWLVEEVSQ